MLTLRTMLIILLMGVVLGVPLAIRPQDQSSSAQRTLIIVTPHNEQIRSEFRRAFQRWHLREHGEPVQVVWNTPGGTTEIRRMLTAQYTAALRAGQPPGGNADLVLGGGSYEHDSFKRPIVFDQGGMTRSTTISVPVDFDPAWLAGIYGENMIGDQLLYDPQQHWFGTALSGFGIVFNRDVLAHVGAPEPRRWDDLCDPRLRGWVALVNPGQSGSITTAMDAILQHRGWEVGWRLLRRMAANARYFSASASKAPIDVGQGQAGAGICIDFYGRYQSQAIRENGGGDRIGYVDPPRETSIDADPISMLRGAREPQLARRFIQFCLTDEGQALWQLPARGDSATGLGPERYELRRMPILRSMYAAHQHQFVDRDVNPYQIAQAVERPNRGIRAFIAPLFTAMAMDNHHELRAAWEAIITHPAYPSDRAIVTASDVDDPMLKRMLELFDAMPQAPGSDGSILSLQSDERLKLILEGWKTPGLWPVQARPEQVSQRQWTAFFQQNYDEIVRLAGQ